MIILRWAALIAGLALTGPVNACGDSTAPSSCCKVCKTGKACGDSCIAKSDTCTKGAGCACNG
jgi:hypothetical protein